jgi:hypothetical protein
MTVLPLIDCAHQLSIDTKTLRHWLQGANMSLSAHPTDARVKCLTSEQVQQLASVHGRTLKPLSGVAMEPAPLSRPEPSQPLDLAGQMAEGTSLSSPTPQEADLRQQLSQLERQVAILQSQLTQLTLELLQERTQRTEQRLQTLEELLPPMQRQEAPPQALQCRQEHLLLVETAPKERSLHPAEQRVRSCVPPPLIEYGADGTYLILCPQEGELPLVPDTPEWFEWFRTLSSFRFRGQRGRFGASRGYHRHHPTRTWYAHRTIHQQEYKHYLGVSEHLTIEVLEQMAARFQADGEGA